MQASALVPVVAQEGGAIAGFLPIVLIIAVFYFLLIRPQQKRARQHRELVESVGVGDRVVTIGGMHGTVRSVDEETIRLELAPNMDVTLAKQAVSRRLIDADAGELGDAGTV
ncbi:MAG TPA: preprotein translocase subunit YajC [Egibacteraceae bacterium]|jgi:preprotein translocase subunit YajC|nr:preprotein translocase subunit YajC [Egibacteraceae bacterium]